MLRHYLMVATRHLARHRLYSFINIAGLALGLACVIFITLYIRYETSYDKWVPDSARLYKLELTANIPGRPPLDTALIPFPIPQAMAAGIPGVVAATRLRPEEMTLTAGNRQFLETVDVVDPNFFRVIRLPLISGQVSGVLAQPESLVLSEDAARRFFGSANPIGRTITIRRAQCAATDTACRDPTIDLTVTGVARNLPLNSQLAAQVVMPDTSMADRTSQADKEDWLSANHYGYVLLAPHAEPREVLARLAREISLRKCVGASRRQLIAQFLGGSVAMALCALTIALVLVEVLLPFFDGFMMVPITFRYLADWQLSLVIVSIAVAAGLISGSYPALVLSGFRPGAELRSNNSGPTGSGRLRTTLVLLQFAVSIGLGISAMVVSHQIGFARNIELGFDPNDIVVMRTGNDPGTQSFIEAVRSHPGVVGAALSSEVPFSSGHPLGLVQLPGRSGTITVDKLMIGSDFSRLYGIPLMAGRLLSEGRDADALSDSIQPGNDGHNILINAVAAARFGYSPAQAIGRMITYNSSPVRIVGVLANAKFRGVMESVRPTVYFYDKYGMYTLSIRISEQDVPATLAFIDRTWRAFAPFTSSQRFFLSAGLQTLYRGYQREGLMFEIFVGIAMVIACLGLLGLAVFTAERRTKEIGVRKVSGARTPDIMRLMLWRISVPVLAANVIAWPVAYYYLHHWLQGYAYRISLNPLYFVATGGIALLIAWATVCAHTLRLAKTRPVHALRYE